MPDTNAREGLTRAGDLAVQAREVDFVTRFTRNWEALSEILGIMRPVRKAPGSTVTAYTASVDLESGDVGEGEEIPYSRAILTATASHELTLRKYAKAVSIEAVKDIYYRDGKPLGLTKHTYPPKDIPKFDLLVTDENLVKALRVFIELCDRPVYSTSAQIVEEMKRQGVWERGEGMEETMYFTRHYRSAWLEYGWIERDPKHSRRFIPTERGRMVAETFFTK